MRAAPSPTTPESPRARICRTLRDPGWRPPVLPHEAMEVHRLSMEPLPSPAPVLEVLERSAFLSGEVLRVARTASYSGARPPRNLQEAVVRLGTRTLADLVMEIAMSRKVFRAKGYAKAAEGVRRNAVASAHAARLIARVGGTRQGIAFLGGLLHPVGYSLSMVILGTAPAGRRPALADVWRDIEAAQREARALALSAWGMPADLQAVLSGADPGRDDLRDTFAAILLGNIVGAQAAPLPLAGEKEHLHLNLMDAALGRLGLGPARWADLEGRAIAAAETALST